MAFLKACVCTFRFESSIYIGYGKSFLNIGFTTYDNTCVLGNNTMIWSLCLSSRSSHPSPIPIWLFGPFLPPLGDPHGGLMGQSIGLTASPSQTFARMIREVAQQSSASSLLNDPFPLVLLTNCLGGCPFSTLRISIL
jgi:hypothetical protein